MPLNNSHIHHHPSDTTNGDKSHDTNDHPPPVIVQETDDEDDILQQQQDDLATTAIPLLEIDEETLNSGAEGYVRFDLYIILYYIILYGACCVVLLYHISLYNSLNELTYFLLIHTFAHHFIHPSIP